MLPAQGIFSHAFFCLFVKWLFRSSGFFFPRLFLPVGEKKAEGNR